MVYDFSAKGTTEINNYLKQNNISVRLIVPPENLGTEYCAFEWFYEWCLDNYKEPNLDTLDNPLVDYDTMQIYTKKYDKKVEHYNNYFAERRNEDGRIISFKQGVKIKANYSHMGMYKNHLLHRCIKFFEYEIDTLAEIFCVNQYGSVQKAFENTEHFIELWNEFEYWFDEKRKSFMSKEIVVKVDNKNGVVKGRNRQPVGAVSNLLKTLTKTMELQGADIRSIAKVQYTICTQMGIYIPNEFLTDVAVAMDIEGEFEQNTGAQSPSSTKSSDEWEGEVNE